MNTDQIARMIEKLDELQASITEIRKELTDELVRINERDTYTNQNEYRVRLLGVLGNIEARTTTEFCNSLVGDIRDEYVKVWGDEVSSHKIGKLLRAIGLEPVRTRFGYLANWKKGDFSNE